MPVIAHNLCSQFTNRQLNIATNSKTKATEKLSSGYKINKAADDAANLKISEKMRSQIRGLSRGEKNTQEGISWIQTGDGAMQEIMDITQRIRELAVQASNDTNSQLERNAIDNEIKQLRKEINMISANTEFNKQKIFDHDGISLNIQGQFNDLQVFNSKYDSTTGIVEYGGFIFNGNRVSWDTISPGMVEIDPATGKQIFTGGTYTYQEPGSGAIFHISSKPGAEVPNITREFDLHAEADGIVIDGMKHAWSELRDEYGSPPNGMISPGVWELEHNGVTIAFYTSGGYDYASMADAFNNERQKYSWKMEYIGTENVKAVDASIMKNLRLSKNTVYNMMTPDDKLSFVVRTDATGIWLENEANPGVEISGSKKTWEDMWKAADPLRKGDWDSGNVISKDCTYTFSDDDTNNDTYIAFDFTLDDVTSLDSVIDGLDGMVIGGGNITNSYAAVPEVTLDNNLLAASVGGGDKVHFSEEKELGRDFDQQIVDGISGNTVAYDPATKNIQLIFPDQSGNPVIEYNGTTNQAEDYLRGDLSTFLKSMEEAKREAAIAGKDPQDADVKPKTIRDVLGQNAITPDGYLSETVTLKPSMNPEDGTMTDGSEESYFKPGEPGKTYPAACIDFAAIGNGSNIYDLVGTGFNSDCKTCDNYYSIRFDDFSLGGTQATNTTPEGYKYSIREVKRLNSNRSNYTLQVDINSLMEQGITTGEELAKAMISITSECFDMHYTQYAVDGSKFYVYDNREQSSGAPSASFDTVPLPQVNVDEFSFIMSTDDGRQMEMLYKYDFTDVRDWMHIEMEEVTDGSKGEYVPIDPNDLSQGYRRYDPANPDHANLPTYNLTEKFQMLDKDGNPVGTLTSMEEVVEKYAQHAMDKMLGNTKVTLNALDYTYMDVAGDEKPNVAVKSIFESSFKEIWQEGIHIQNSAVVHDSVRLPKFKLNELVLNLYKAGTRTYEEAQATIDMADDAVRVLSEKRSLYGAWQNRLEHIYANSCNMEENATASESRIRDTDYAEEMVTYASHNILEQAGQALLAKSNMSLQGVLDLIKMN